MTEIKEKEVTEIPEGEQVCATVEDCDCSDIDYCYTEYDDCLILTNSEEIEICGSPKQRQTMFEAWANYIGEISNPDNTAINPFHKSKYAPLDEVLNTTRPILSKYGFGIMQSPTCKTNIVSVKTVLLHKCGGAINFPALSLPIAKNDAQGVIAGITYARRGALNPILGTHGETDDDGNTAAGKDNKKPSTKPATQKSTTPQPVLDMQKSVVSLAKELISGGTDRDVVNKTIKDNCKSENPNSVKDLDLLKKAYDGLDAIREGSKAIN